VTLVNTDAEIAELREAVEAAELDGYPAPKAYAAIDTLERLRKEAAERAAVYERAARWANAPGKTDVEIVWKPNHERVIPRWETEWETHEGAFFGRTPHAMHGDGPTYVVALKAALDAVGAP
jgi:hypothetical protein